MHTGRDQLEADIQRALKWHYEADDKHRELSGPRADGCEIVAWRFLSRLSEREAVDYCLYEIPELADEPEPEPLPETIHEDPSERSPLFRRATTSNGGARRSMPQRHKSVKRSQLLQSLSRLTASFHSDDSDDEEDPTIPFRGLNALEIAAISNAKQFLGQAIVQKIVTAIWNGDIVFWDRLDVQAVKKPRYYNPSTADPFSRLRVPKYLKVYEIFFFVGLMALYYTVLVEVRSTPAVVPPPPEEFPTDTRELAGHHHHHSRRVRSVRVACRVPLRRAERLERRRVHLLHLRHMERVRHDHDIHRNNLCLAT